METFVYMQCAAEHKPKAKRDALRTSHEGRSPEFRSHRRMSPWNSNR
ncbi:MAG: hypothetical protein IJV18_05445 [Acidaminococcaceae bacterium]|nr:hypothetical protein [Acidaminococcaceae bacterium]